MWNNYIKSAIRNLSRRKFTMINILGLAIAIACAPMIALFIRHELSYDRFHEHSDRIYRATFERTLDTDVIKLATTSPPMGPAIVKEFPEVIRSVRMRYAREVLLTYRDKQFYEDGFYYADSTFFDIFSFPFVSGNPKTALDDPGSIVLTIEMAEKYFGDADPIGKTLQLNDERDFIVTGVLEPLPHNAHLRFDFLVPFSAFTIPPGYTVTFDDWGWGGFFTYVLLAEEADVTTLQPKLKELVETNFRPEVISSTKIGLQPITDIYLNPEYREHYGVVAAGNKMRLYGLGTIGLLLLLIAGFNYTNLATAQALERAREVGIRKALGASRLSLIRQFMGESLLLCGLSTLAGATLATLLIEEAAVLFGVNVNLTSTDLSFLVIFSTVVWLVTGLFAGSYPAFVLSQFQPNLVLKGETPVHVSGGGLRSILIVLQFAASMALVASTFIIIRQMNFVRNKDLGFDRESVVALHLTGDAYGRYYERIRTRLLQNPNVIRVSAGDLFDGNVGSVPIYYEAAPDPEEGMVMNIFGIHFDFLETTGIEIIEGRGLSQEIPTDSAEAIILNQAAVDALGWEDPIGKRVQVFDIRDGRVVGVVENFHFASLHDEVAPLVLFLPRVNMGNILVRIAPGDLQSTLESLNQAWKEAVPDLPFDFTFLDEQVDQMYRSEERFSRFMTIFAGIAILVACMGLYGLVVLTVKQRTRELAIRKILGGSAGHLTWIVSNRFMRLIVVACLISIPVAFFAGEHWLRDFAYRIEVDYMPFAIAAVLIFLLSGVTTVVHALRAAYDNPVKSLRQE